ncbi:AAA family ATPase [Salegentibacter chungangensis]|uniref:AAA family ATPase n=1 Tax=Salegentibacter chungangensis TaxID=1335724 RepID=A0ABW3NRK3_9FLAO
MSKKKIVITGGPGTGKSSIIHNLEAQGNECLHEISRQVTLEAQKEGIAQLFLEKPLLFSEKLLEGRIRQHYEAEEKTIEPIFIDRGIPDVIAYMDYFETRYTSKFTEACERHSYHQVFILPPWKEIYKSDNERYETFEEALAISKFLNETYKRFGYQPVEVPKGPVEERANFILNNLDD